MTKSEIAKKSAAAVQRVFKSLPKRIVCPKCGKNRTPKSFGCRVMARDSKGIPTRVARQSYCVHCR